MGVTVLQLPSSARRTSDCTFIPVHIRGLFYEYLKRYQDLEHLRRRETNWLILVLFLGFVSLTNLVYLNSTIIAFSSFILFSLFLKHYITLKKSVNHAYVNAHILHHHLLGKLEVGFCDHETHCQCVDQFKKFVWNKYRISLYGSSIF